MRIILGITGASGAVYGISLANALEGHELHIVITPSGRKIMEEELGEPDAIGKQLSKFSKLHDADSFDSPLASGSFLFDAMVVCPCSMKTLSAIANGYSSNLLCRTADVALKEGRKLVLVTRETPLSPVHLENMLKLSRLGVAILPACPAFYTKPQKISDIVDFIVGRVLDVLGIPNKRYRRWRHA